MTATGYVGGDPSKVDLDGYTKGDVLAANTAGELTAIPVGTDSFVLTANSVDAEGVDWQAGGGGGGATPANTVVTETAFGQASASGAATSYSRGDHTHGTPAAPSVPTAAATVVTETTFGQSAVVGTDTQYARQDHTHGTPASPTVPTASVSVVTEQAFGQPSAVGAAATFSRGDHTHGTPAAPASSSLVARIAYVTTGDVTAANAGDWTLLAGLSLSIPATAGQYIELSTAVMLNFGGSTMFYDIGVVVGGVGVRFMSNGTATPATEGAPSMYPSPGSFRTMSNPFAFQAVSGDISGGTITFGIFNKGTSDGNAKVYASAGFPFFWRAMNYGTVALS